VRSKISILLFIIAAGIIIGFFAMRPASGPQLIVVGSAVPDFQLTDINKNTSNLSDMKGTVVLINFWATWCSSCIDEMPSLERLFRNMSADQKFKMVTILYRDDGIRANNFMRQNGFTFPVYLNPDGVAAKMFGITGVPETFIIDKKGVLREKVLGPAEWDSPTVMTALQQLINEP
jgi:peroxiredoxin